MVLDVVNLGLFDGSTAVHRWERGLVFTSQRLLAIWGPREGEVSHRGQPAALPGGRFCTPQSRLWPPNPGPQPREGKSYLRLPGNTAQTSTPWLGVAGPAVGVRVWGVSEGGPGAQPDSEPAPMAGPPRPWESGQSPGAPVCLVWAGTGPAPEPRPHPPLRGIITFGEVKGSTPHPAWPRGLGTEWGRETPRPQHRCPFTGISEPRPRVPLHRRRHRHPPPSTGAGFLTVRAPACLSPRQTGWF